jgi:hypothetical protein
MSGKVNGKRPKIAKLIEELKQLRVREKKLLGQIEAANREQT